MLWKNGLRTDLSPIDEAHAFDALMELTNRQAGWVARELNERGREVDKDQITFAVGLLDLPNEIQSLIAQGALSPTIAYQICGQYGIADDSLLQVAIAKKAAVLRLNRREVEELIEEVAFYPRELTAVAREILSAVHVA